MAATDACLQAIGTERVALIGQRCVAAFAERPGAAAAERATVYFTLPPGGPT